MKKPEKTTKNGAKQTADAKNDLTTLPLDQVEKKIGYSPDGLSNDRLKLLAYRFLIP